MQVLCKSQDDQLSSLYFLMYTRVIHELVENFSWLRGLHSSSRIVHMLGVVHWYSECTVYSGQVSLSITTRISPLHDIVKVAMNQVTVLMTHLLMVQKYQVSQGCSNIH